MWSRVVFHLGPDLWFLDHAKPISAAGEKKGFRFFPNNNFGKINALPEQCVAAQTTWVRMRRHQTR
jgi:hypothetical protein